MDMVVMYTDEMMVLLLTLQQLQQRRQRHVQHYTPPDETEWHELILTMNYPHMIDHIHVDIAIDYHLYCCH
jgi:hypothetical protein